MTRTELVPTTELRQRDVRLDGGYYCSIGEDTRRLLKRVSANVEKIRDVSTRIFIGGRTKRHYVNDKSLGVPFLSSSDMLLADLTNVPYVSRRAQTGLAEALLSKGWTLISRSGTIGNVAYANADFVGKAASEHVMRVVPNDRIGPGYLFAWLSSVGGVGLLKQGTFGSVIPTMEPSFVADLPIPRLDDATEQAIHDRIAQAGAKRVEANRMLADAREHVYDATGLPKHGLIPVGRNLAGVRTFTVPSSSLGSRFEARFHDAIVRDMQEAIRNNQRCGWLELGQCATSIFQPDRGKRIDAAVGGVPLVGSGDMFSARPVASRNLSLTLSPGVQELLVRPNDILVARSGQIYSILGDAVIVGRSLAGKAVSEHAIRVRLDVTVTHPGFLFSFLTLGDYGYGQIIRTAYGTSIPSLSVDDMCHILVPMPHERDRDDIGTQVLQAIELRDQANDLEDEAQEILRQALDAAIAERHGERVAVGG